jgi:hypothetical protein
MKNSYRILVENVKGNMRLGGPKRKWGDVKWDLIGLLNIATFLVSAQLSKGVEYISEVGEPAGRIPIPSMTGWPREALRHSTEQNISLKTNLQTTGHAKHFVVSKIPGVW